MSMRPSLLPETPPVAVAVADHDNGNDSSSSSSSEHTIRHAGPTARQLMDFAADRRLEVPEAFSWHVLVSVLLDIRHCTEHDIVADELTAERVRLVVPSSAAAAAAAQQVPGGAFPEVVVPWLALRRGRDPPPPRLDDFWITGQFMSWFRFLGRPKEGPGPLQRWGMVVAAEEGVQYSVTRLIEMVEPHYKEAMERSEGMPVWMVEFMAEHMGVEKREKKMKKKKKKKKKKKRKRVEAPSPMWRFTEEGDSPFIVAREEGGGAAGKETKVYSAEDATSFDTKPDFPDESEGDAEYVCRMEKFLRLESNVDYIKLISRLSYGDVDEPLPKAVDVAHPRPRLDGAAEDRFKEYPLIPKLAFFSNELDRIHGATPAWVEESHEKDNADHEYHPIRRMLRMSKECQAKLQAEIRKRLDLEVVDGTRTDFGDWHPDEKNEELNARVVFWARFYCNQVKLFYGDYVGGEQIELLASVIDMLQMMDEGKLPRTLPVASDKPVAKERSALEEQILRARDEMVAKHEKENDTRAKFSDPDPNVIPVVIDDFFN